MIYIFNIADMFFKFLREELVPFFTMPISSFEFPIAYPSGDGWDYFLVELPWLFPNHTFGEFILIGGLLFFICYRFVKFFTDIVF